MLITATLGVLLQVAAPMPTFAARAQMVYVPVSATDARTGVPVSDLTAEDFVVFEDGKRQEVRYFGLEAVPASVLILLDTSVSVQELLPAIRDAASNLIRSLRPGDEVHVATFDVAYRVLCDFTTDHGVAVKSLEGVPREGPETALNTAMYTATRFLERRFAGEMERRRILILLSDGEDNHGTLSYESVEEVLRRSVVVCYVVHVQRALSTTPSVMALTERAAKFVQSIVHETGGRLVSVKAPHRRQEIVGAFSGIAAELGSQYHIGYASSADQGKVGWRTIGVVLPSRIGVRLRFRRGYYVAARR